MAIFSHRQDLTQCKREHLGPLLLSQFLAQGFVEFRLSGTEYAHFREKLKTDDPVSALSDEFVAAAEKFCLENDLEDWNFSRADGNIQGMLTWNPDRVPYALIKGVTG